MASLVARLQSLIPPQALMVMRTLSPHWLDGSLTPLEMQMMPMRTHLSPLLIPALALNELKSHSVHCLIMKNRTTNWTSTGGEA